MGATWVVTGAAVAEKITSTRPMVPAAAEIPASARADAAGCW